MITRGVRQPFSLALLLSLSTVSVAHAQSWFSWGGSSSTAPANAVAPPPAAAAAPASATPSASVAAPTSGIPRPPGLVPNVPGSLPAPPTTASLPAAPSLPAAATQTRSLSSPEVGSQNPLIPPNLGGIAASARFGRDGTPITAGVTWRVYPDRPDQSGAFRPIKEEKGASPTFTLPPGSYILHASLGLASVAKKVQVRTDTSREVVDIPAGAVKFEGRVGDTRIQTAHIAFDIFKGSQFDLGEKKPIISDVKTADTVLLPEGTYHVLSNYGDGNAVMRYDFRVQAGKLTDTRINHRAAMITMKLVSERGGEALANTAWSVLTPGGDVIKESFDVFPAVVLAEGEYVAIAKYEGKVFNREFKVEPGIDREIELLAR